MTRRSATVCVVVAVLIVAAMLTGATLYQREHRTAPDAQDGVVRLKGSHDGIPAPPVPLGKDVRAYVLRISGAGESAVLTLQSGTQSDDITVHEGEDVRAHGVAFHVVHIWAMPRAANWAVDVRLNS